MHTTIAQSNKNESSCNTASHTESLRKGDDDIFHLQGIHRRQSKREPRSCCGIRSLALYIAGCFVLIRLLAFDKSSLQWITDSMLRTDRTTPHDYNHSLDIADQVLDVPVQPIPPRVDEDIRTMGDQTCMFHDKIFRVQNVLPDHDTNVGYILVDTSCPSPFFMIRWSGAALILAEPVVPPIDVDEFVFVSNLAEGLVRDEAENASYRENDSDPSHRNDPAQEIEAQYQLDPLERDDLHRFVFGYNMSAAPAGRYSLEMVGIRCNFRSDLQSLDYDPADNAVMNIRSDPLRGAGDATLMGSLYCVANPACGLSLIQRHLMTFDGGSRNVHADTIISSQEDELWVVESTVASLDMPLDQASSVSSGGMQGTNYTNEDEEDDLPTKVTTRYQEPMCFYKERLPWCDALNSQGPAWYRYHYRSTLTRRNIVEKLVRAAATKPMKICMMGDSHSRYIADSAYFVNNVQFVFVRFSPDLTAAHAQQISNNRPGGPEVRVMLDNGVEATSAALMPPGARLLCLSERTIRYRKSDEQDDDIVICTSSPKDVVAPWFRGHFEIPEGRRIASVIVRDYIVQDDNDAEGSNGTKSTSVWFGGGYDQGGQVIRPSPTIASVHITMEPGDVMGVYSVWNTSISQSEIVTEGIDATSTLKYYPSISRLIDYRFDIPSTVNPVPSFNLSSIAVVHTGRQRPFYIAPHFERDERNPNFPFNEDCDYSAMIMGQWMGTDPYTLDRLHDEMVRAVRRIRSVVEHNETALQRVWWRSHNSNPLRATSLSCPAISWHDPSIAWAYNVVMERVVRQEGGPLVEWMPHSTIMNPAWDRAMDGNHAIVAFYYEALEVFNAVANQALADRNLS